MSILGDLVVLKIEDSVELASPRVVEDSVELGLNPTVLVDSALSEELDEVIDATIFVLKDPEVLEVTSESSNAVLIAVSKGLLPYPQVPRKSSVSILQIMILVMPSFLAYSILDAIELASSYDTQFLFL